MSERWEPARRGPLVAVPLYRSPQLVPPLFAALEAMADELAALDARVLLIDDSPGDAGLREALATHMPALAAACDASLVANAANIGFVRTANRALSIALAEGRDAILLNSDAIPIPGAFAEMAAVAAADPMCGVVGPRSDNATICNSPYPGALRPDPDAALAAHRLIAPLLPRATAVPTAVGFCLLIRHAMLARFGLFDEVYGGGYNEENDYIRRIGRHGFRAILANRAYVHHLGTVSFAASGEGRTAREIANRALLDARYPEYGPAVDRWFEGAEYRAQRLLAGLVPDRDGRRRITFDTRDGHDEAARALVSAFVARHGARWRVRLFGPLALDGTDRADLDACETPSAAAVRIGSPRTVHDVVTFGECAPATLLLMTDATPLDHAARDGDDVATLWQGAAETIALIGYPDEAVRERVRHDIAVPADVGEVAIDADAIAAACEAAAARIDHATLRRRQARVALFARLRAAEAKARAAAGFHARAEALAADLKRPS